MKKIDNMKTKLTLMILSMMFGMMQLQADELNFRLNEEAQVNDIPFNTALISNEVKTALLMNSAFEMTEEEYVDDIPFNTAAVVENSQAETSEFKMEDEGYVNDIPFNTSQIVNILIINN